MTGAKAVGADRRCRRMDFGMESWSLALNASTAIGSNAITKASLRSHDVVSRQRGEVVEVAQRNLPGEVAGCLQRCLCHRRVLGASLRPPTSPVD